MDAFERLIEFESSAFPRVERDEELANADSMYGFSLAHFTARELETRGYAPVWLVAEDWGWYCEAKFPEFALAYGLVGYEGTDEFLIQFIPDKPFKRKFLLKKVYVSEQLLQLHEDVFDILSKAPNSKPPKWIEG